MNHKRSGPAPENALSWAVCPACTCLCDDLTFDDAEHPAQLKGLCSKGRLWFGSRQLQPANECRVDGRPSTLAFAISAAARLLAESNAPLFTGLAPWSLAAQQQAVELARRCGGYIDVDWCDRQVADRIALQSAGCVSATLGQVNRAAEVVVFWCCDPRDSHPRWIERFCQASRHIYFVSKNQPVDLASDTRFQWISLGADEERLAIDALRRKPTDPGKTAEPWPELAAEFRRTCHLAIVQSVSDVRGDDLETSLALHQLVRELNDVTRCTLTTLREDGNAAAAEAALSWTFGHPRALRIRPHGAGADSQYDEFASWRLLNRGACDLVLTGAAPAASPDRQSELAQLPTISLYGEPQQAMADAVIAIPVAEVGWDAAGDMMRMDNVLLSVPQIHSSNRPTAESVLAELRRTFDAAAKEKTLP